MSQLCRNCGEKVEGIFCFNCGQKNDVERLRLASLADNFISTFFGDGAIDTRRNNVRYGLVLTIWALATRPGQTVSEYLEGRRRKYFNPVTVLLLLSGFYALVAVLLGVVNDTPKPSDSQIRYLFNIISAYSSSHPAMLHLLMLPFMALTYKWFFHRRSDLSYIEYAYVGIFAAIFAVLLLLLQLPFEAIPALQTHAADYAQAARYAALCWFSATVFRTLFKISWKRAIWSWLGTYTVAFILCVLMIAALIVLSVVGYYLLDPEGYKEAFGFILKDDITPLHDAAQSAGEAIREGVDSLRTK